LSAVVGPKASLRSATSAAAAGRGGFTRSAAPVQAIAADPHYGN